MSALTHRNHMQLLEGIERIHGATTLPQLMNTTLDALTRLVACDAAVFGHRDLKTATFHTAWSPVHVPLDRYGEPYERHLSEHPLMNHFTRSRNWDPKRISDVVGEADFARRGIFHEFYRPLRLNRQLGMIFRPGARSFVGVSVNRQGREFSSKDVLLFKLLRPHVDLAVRRLRVGQAACPSRANGAVKQGAIASLTGSMRTANWRARLLDLDDAPQNVPSPAGVGAMLRESGLTPRQMEVLHWVVEGKTNPEIGIILGTSPRTIQKHLEHIFQKLGVETRTTAAVRAIELFGDGDGALRPA